VAGLSEDHEIIGVIHDLRAMTLRRTAHVPRQHESSEVSVGQQGRDDSALRRAGMRILRRRRSAFSVGSPLDNRRIEPLTHHLEHRVSLIAVKEPPMIGVMEPVFRG